MPDITVEGARSLVVAHWRENGVFSPQTLEKFSALLLRFCQFAEVLGVTALADIDATIVARFVRARGRQRTGEVGEPAVATMLLRRAVVRCFYRTARALGLTFDDPARDVTLPRRETGRTRPLTADEAEVVWMHAWSGGRQTRHPATIALLLAGAHSGEVGHITAADVDEATGTVLAHGSSKYTPRLLVPQPRHFDALLERCDWLMVAQASVPPDTVVLATGAGGSDAHKQARVCVTAGEVLALAGLGDDPAIRPASITAVAGVQAFEATRSIEAAAVRLGLGSLDSAARAIAWNWQVR